MRGIWHATLLDTCPIVCGWHTSGECTSMCSLKSVALHSLQILAGSTSGTIAAALSSPLELIKVRLLQYTHLISHHKCRIGMSLDCVVCRYVPACGFVGPWCTLELLHAPHPTLQTRLQAKGAKHTSPIAVVQHVVQQDGVAGLWRGAVPGVQQCHKLFWWLYVLDHSP